MTLVINKNYLHKMTRVNSSKLEHYQHEFQTWERMLDFFKQENSFLKTRLSEVLDQKIDKEFLANAEHFQNKFIIQDEFMDELKHDIREVKGIFEKNITAIGLDKVTENKYKRLRNEIEYLEKSFSSVKNDFNDYLLSV